MYPINPAILSKEVDVLRFDTSLLEPRYAVR